MKRLDEILLVIAENNPEDGDGGSEGIVSGRVGPLWLPLMISTMPPGGEQRTNVLRSAANKTANESGQTVRIIKFIRAEIVETITPEPRVVIKCPECGAETDARAEITPDQLVSTASVEPTDISLCYKCRSICKYNRDHTALILMTDDEIAELPEATRAMLSRARAQLRRLSE